MISNAWIHNKCHALTMYLSISVQYIPYRGFISAMALIMIIQSSYPRSFGDVFCKHNIFKFVLIQVYPICWNCHHWLH